MLRRFEHLPEILTVDEAAKFLGIGRNTTYEAVRRGELPSVKVGRRILIPVGALRRFLEQCSWRDTDGAR